MLISDKLKTFDFTDSEKEIVKYFLNQKEEIENKSTREISKKLYCSPSSIIRLCQKLGFTGFEEFKEMYVEELHYLNSNFSDINPSIPFMTEDNIQTISNKMCSLYHEIIDDTHSLLDHDMLRKSLNLLKNNKNIYIISSGSQNDLALTFRDKMARIGKHVNVYQSIDEPYYEACYLNKGDACFLLISYTGETQNCIRMARKLNERNIDFIVLAGYLAILTDELIDAYPNKIMNIHPSLIPSFCGPGMYGMHVHEAVLQRGAKVSGATVHFVSNIVDGGPIIKQVACDISDLDTAEDIQKRVLEIEHKLLPEVVGLYCDNKIKIIDGKAKVI